MRITVSTLESCKRKKYIFLKNEKKRHRKMAPPSGYNSRVALSTAFQIGGVLFFWLREFSSFKNSCAKQECWAGPFLPRRRSPESNQHGFETLDYSNYCGEFSEALMLVSSFRKSYRQFFEGISVPYVFSNSLVMGRVHFWRVWVEHESDSVEYGPSTSLRVSRDSLPKNFFRVWFY